MCKVDIKNGDTRIDPCMRKIIKYLNAHDIKTKMCCCGHGVYPMSIIIQHPKFKNYSIEIFSGYGWWDKKKFYKRDKKGIYCIPEVVKTK